MALLVQTPPWPARPDGTAAHIGDDFHIHMRMGGNSDVMMAVARCWMACFNLGL